MLRAAPDYHELNAGAHRKFPKVLTAPSMIWHLAFWTNVRQKKTPDQIKDALDEFIIAFCGAVAGKVTGLKLSPCISNICLLFNNTCHRDRPGLGRVELDRQQNDIFASTSRAVSVQFVWLKLDVTIRFEIHTEYFSISTFVELKTREKIGLRMPDSGVADLNRNIEAVVHYLRAADKSPIDDKQMEGINKYFFRDFWKTYETEFLSHESLRALMKDEIFKQVFADFRGLIASDQAVEFADDGFFKGDKPPTWGQKAKEKFLPLIQHRDPVEQTEYECVMNYMLDGRAFYMSTLGPQAPSPAKQRTPVEFIVYAHQCYNDTTVVNKWQLGRLVSQLLLLGTLRLSALKDIKSLHKAGQLLEQLDEITRAARDAIALAEVEASASKANRGSISKRDQPAGPSVEEAMIEFLFRAHKKLNDVTGNFLDATGSGLTFRIERSRYYVKQFEDNVEMLRIKRVEGDQPYDLFIKRRLGSEFDFIDRLGIRYERAVRTMETLDQDRSRGLQMEISGETNSIQSDIQTIQAGGEAILLAFLVPYYVSHLLVLIFGEGASYIPIMTVNVWLIGFAVAIGRYSKKLTLSTAVWFCFRLLVLLALLFPVERQILYWLNASKQPENAGSLHSGTGMQRQIQPPMTAPDENRKSAPAEPPTSEPKP